MDDSPVITYSGAAYPYVPMTRVDTWVWSPIGPSFASPKSDSFALKSCHHYRNKKKIIPEKESQNSQTTSLIALTFVFQKDLVIVMANSI